MADFLLEPIAADARPYRLLALGVIAKAAEAATGGGENAKWWLQGKLGRGDLEFWCTCAGIEAKRVIEHAQDAYRDVVVQPWRVRAAPEASPEIKQCQCGRWFTRRPKSRQIYCGELECNRVIALARHQKDRERKRSHHGKN